MGLGGCSRIVSSGASRKFCIRWDETARCHSTDSKDTPVNLWRLLVDEFSETDLRDEAADNLNQENRVIRKAADTVGKWCFIGCAVLAVIEGLWDWLVRGHDPTIRGLLIGFGSVCAVWWAAFLVTQLTEGIRASRERMIRIELLIKEQARIVRNR